MRPTLLKLHLILAIVSGAFITVLGVTGAIMAFEPEIDHWQHRALMDAVPAGALHSLADIASALEQRYPGERVTAFVLGATPSRAYAISMGRRTVYVNPYTLDVQGERAPGATWLTNVHQLHLRLLTTWGRQVVRWTGVLLIVALLTGLCLWWPSRRVGITTGQSPFRTWFDVHNAVGAFSFVFLFLLAITGVAIGFDNISGPLAYRLTKSAPTAPISLRVAAVAGTHPITPDRALEIARAALPGATPFLVPNVGPTDAYSVRARFPEDLTPGGRSRVVIHPYTGEV
ncbi:MAG: PepSY-associated TM helix domain-containing protein, partial [Vicinamibacterales bacterium]